MYYINDDNDNDNGYLDIQKSVLKRRIIENIISCIYNRIYNLKGGFLPNNIVKEIKKSAAYDGLLLFIEYGKINNQKLFTNNHLKDLIQKIYEAIDEVSIADEFNPVNNNINYINYNCLRTTSKNANEILELQRKFIKDFNQYLYSIHEARTIYGWKTMDGFINFRPFDRNLSSGEMSLLNLFSRINNLFDQNLEDVNYIQPKSHYILLLDEADLTFHPTWKKKYVKGATAF